MLAPAINAQRKFIVVESLRAPPEIHQLKYNAGFFTKSKKDVAA